MSRQSLTAVRSQAGFTLVELAVVMIIIGLLIGGVLKGQELVKNAQITSTIAQVKATDAATSTFKDMFAGIPGDLRNPVNRLPGCTTAPACSALASATTLGNGQLETAPNVTPTGEAQAFYVQLALADLITGIDVANNTCTQWGNCFPEAKAGSGAGLQIGYYGGTAGLGLVTAAPFPPRGHYVAIHANPGAGELTTVGGGALTPSQAFRIDSKVDDGRPLTGSVVGGGNSGCIATSDYNGSNASADCNIYLRIQG